MFLNVLELWIVIWYVWYHKLEYLFNILNLDNPHWFLQLTKLECLRVSLKKQSFEFQGVGWSYILVFLVKKRTSDCECNLYFLLVMFWFNCNSSSSQLFAHRSIVLTSTGCFWKWSRFLQISTSWSPNHTYHPMVVGWWMVSSS